MIFSLALSWILIVLCWGVFALPHEVFRMLLTVNAFLCAAASSSKGGGLVLPPPAPWKGERMNRVNVLRILRVVLLVGAIWFLSSCIIEPVPVYPAYRYRPYRYRYYYPRPHYYWWGGEEEDRPTLAEIGV